MRGRRRQLGEKKAYLPNVTGDTETMLRRAVMVKREGGRYVMVDIVTAGFAGLLSLRRADLGLVIHAHRAMYASFARSRRHGISMLVLAKLARLAGVDQLHIGRVVGKMEGDREEVLACHRALGNQTGALPGAESALPPQDWRGIKPVLAVASGGLHPGHIPDLVSIFGRDVLLQFGGGVHGHPKGTRAGAQAVQEAVEAVVAGTSLAAAAESREALRTALSCWGGM
ncbi:RuBisCO large subunit C-terminal-like domain-containing protein [Thermodesulfitimonas sp.]